MLVLLLAGGASATTLTVNASGGADYTRIQDAVNAASNGDTITVAAGNYNENLYIGKIVNLVGAGAEITTVQATNPGNNVFLVTANYVNITGFKITGASEKGAIGIYISRANYTNISFNNISNNSRGIWLTLSINNNKLMQNVISNNMAGGVLLHFSTYNNTLIENILTSNRNGIQLINTSNNTIEGNLVQENSNGISIRSVSRDNIIRDNYIKYNEKYGFISDFRGTLTFDVSINSSLYTVVRSSSDSSGADINFTKDNTGLYPSSTRIWGNYEAFYYNNGRNGL